MKSKGRQSKELIRMNFGYSCSAFPFISYDCLEYSVLLHSGNSLLHFFHPHTINARKLHVAHDTEPNGICLDNICRPIRGCFVF